MKVKQPANIIRTDKWALNPTTEQRHLFGETVNVYRRVCRYLVGIVFTHWPELGGLSPDEQIPAAIDARYGEAACREIPPDRPGVSQVPQLLPQGRNQLCSSAD